MKYLLDTNVVSEIVRSRPDPNVLRWLEQIPDDSLYLSVLTLGELRKGILKIGDRNRCNLLLDWLENDLIDWCSNQILSIDRLVAERWGQLLGESGQTLPAINSLLAATALHHKLHLATRNVHDFQFKGLTVVNPWLFMH